MDKLLDLSLRKVIRKFQRSVMRQTAPITAASSVIEFLGKDQYLAVSRLGRYVSGNVVTGGLSVRFTDNLALFGMLDEIFIRENYRFDSESASPIIIDCGANIGLSVLYCKSLYPDAVIHAIEPDPMAYETLVANVSENGLKDVYTYNAAIWTDNGKLAFESDGSWGGHLAGDTGAGGLKVNAITLGEFVGKRVDFLKMDIEGSESDVILHFKDQIADNVQKLFFEWHSLAGRQQRLGEILSFFERRGFRYHIKEAANRQTPFVYTPRGRMDSQLDVFLWR